MRAFHRPTCVTMLRTIHLILPSSASIQQSESMTMPKKSRQSVSSVSAKRARRSRPGCAKPASGASPPGTFCFRKPEGERLKAAGKAIGVRLRFVRRRRRARRRHHHLGGHRGFERRGGTIGQAASRRRAVFPRHQFGFARPQAGDRKAPRRQRPLRRCRGTRTDPSGAASDADAACRRRRRGDCPALAALGMRVTVAGAEIGAAAAIKMVRSVMIKGIEALTFECFLAAARAGVVEEVAASLKNNYPGLDWTKIMPYNLERMARHGERRAAEMEEVAGDAARTRRRAADDSGHRQAPARNGPDRQRRPRCAMCWKGRRHHPQRHQRGRARPELIRHPRRPMSRPGAAVAAPRLRRRHAATPRRASRSMRSPVALDGIG